MSAPVAHEDFVDLVACLNAEGCDFLVVGAHALAAHGSPRATGDLDVLVRASGRPKDLADAAVLEELISRRAKLGG